MAFGRVLSAARSKAGRLNRNQIDERRLLACRWFDFVELRGEEALIAIARVVTRLVRALLGGLVASGDFLSRISRVACRRVMMVMPTGVGGLILLSGFGV